MKAWLVTWEWFGKHAEKGNKIATILNCRLSGETVAKYIEKLYVDSEFYLSERLEYVKSRKNTPYPARFGTLKVDGKMMTWTGQIHCGHNPFLYGRLVDNIHVEIDSDGKEDLKYDEIPRPERQGR